MTRISPARRRRNSLGRRAVTPRSAYGRGAGSAATLLSGFRAQFIGLLVVKSYASAFERAWLMHAGQASAWAAHNQSPTRPLKLVTFSAEASANRKSPLIYKTVAPMQWTECGFVAGFRRHHVDQEDTVSGMRDCEGIRTGRDRIHPKVTVCTGFDFNRGSLAILWLQDHGSSGECWLIPADAKCSSRFSRIAHRNDWRQAGFRSRRYELPPMAVFALMHFLPGKCYFQVELAELLTTRLEPAKEVTAEGVKWSSPARWLPVLLRASRASVGRSRALQHSH